MFDLRQYPLKIRIFYVFKGQLKFTSTYYTRFKSQFLKQQVDQMYIVNIFRFKESTHLRKHLYTHTGERPHFCSYCSKGFQTSSDLKRHKKTRVHQERVDQCNAERNHSNPETPTEKSNFFYLKSCTGFF